MSFQSTKTYGHEIGLTCAFRQWRAHSHCRFIHGYALAVKLVFGAHELDACGWVVDFGGLKPLRGMLEDTFDHKLLVAEDDPWLISLQALTHPLQQGPGDWVKPCAEIVVVPATGCEAFSGMIFEVAEQWLKDAGFSPRCWLESVEVSEHGANSAIRKRDRMADVQITMSDPDLDHRIDSLIAQIAPGASA